MTPSDIAIERCARHLLGQRAEAASICPSDVARALVADEAGWRALMPQVRRVAARMAREGIVRITQGELAVEPDRIDHGPVRLRRGPKFSA